MIESSSSSSSSSILSSSSSSSIPPRYHRITNRTAEECNQQLKQQQQRWYHYNNYYCHCCHRHHHRGRCTTPHILITIVILLPMVVLLPILWNVRTNGSTIHPYYLVPSSNHNHPSNNNHNRTTTTTTAATTAAAANPTKHHVTMPNTNSSTNTSNIDVSHDENNDTTTDTTTTNTTIPTISNNSPNGYVWLVSFPNSGTTYTISIVQHMTQTSTATNYGGNERDTQHNSVAIDGTMATMTTTDATTNGPFFRSPDLVRHRPSSSSNSSNYDYRNASIITKTHCDHPQLHKVIIPNYMVTLNNHSSNNYSSDDQEDDIQQFIAACATGTKYVNFTSYPVTYTPLPTISSSSTTTSQPQQQSLRGIVYLIRNPFFNIIARMNYQRNQWTRSRDPIDHQRAAFFPKNNRTGLYWWCQYKDRKPSLTRSELLQLNNGTFYTHYLQPIPCFMEFYLYFAWHNRVNAMISYFNNSHTDSSNSDNSNTPHYIPSMKIYYEDYNPSSPNPQQQQQQYQYDSPTTTNTTDTDDSVDRRTKSIIEPLLYDMLHFTPPQIVNHTIPAFVVPNSSSSSDGDSNSTSTTTTLMMINAMYSMEQQMAIRRLGQIMTTPQTWSVLQHYFQHLPSSVSV